MSASAKPVIVISSHVVRGAVGNRAMVFALETLGHAVWALPTVILPWHPGHGPSTRIVPPPDQFAAAIADLAASPWLDEVGAVVSGYLGDESQAEPVARLVEAAKRRNPGCLYVCDPVIGDAGGLYVPEAVAAAIRGRLFPMADIATPNRFEFQWLCGRALDGNEAVVEAARHAGPPRMLVTSAHGRAPGETGNLLASADEALLACHRMEPNPPNGLGDLTAALLTAHLLDGQSGRDALRRTTASVAGMATLSVAAGLRELPLQAHARALTEPSADIGVGAIAGPEVSG